ncbi:redoxin family protein [Epidermidibacterium keratini]|uniref:Redoxin family protein n=1 Tax=Epidermidibacterium keratini TaxID=1891644 RepID=A0A7L4YLH4_9ACTN|nr:TlpA disulfide reductase family protein [Epidermidibacterium keratini]QHC00121.1 redoxin family protein [Epidermidibacterium keratini]
MKTRLGVLLTAAALVLSGCSGAVGRADGTTTSTSAAKSSKAFSVPCPAWDPAAPPPADQALPDVTLECLSEGSEPVSMSGAPPRPTIVNLWATWCAPCRQEIPLLQEFAQKAAGKVDVLGVVTADSASAARDFALEFDMGFPSVIDTDSVLMTDLGMQALPDSVLIRADGSVANVHIGAFSSLEQIVSLVAKELGVNV